MERSQSTVLNSFCFKNTFWYTRGPAGWRVIQSGEHFKIWEGERGKLWKGTLYKTDPQKFNSAFFYCTLPITYNYPLFKTYMDVNQVFSGVCIFLQFILSKANLSPSDDLRPLGGHLHFHCHTALQHCLFLAPYPKVIPLILWGSCPLRVIGLGSPADLVHHRESM